ncbi:hypothetical protein VNO77_33205 [Canavalia gladiata]|uniref:Uncharacterized protein n=1 Tax=Canavalia gladiata TaxID=3824 RepID=A0AAN9KDF8_CANGL
MILRQHSFTLPSALHVLRTLHLLSFSLVSSLNSDNLSNGVRGNVGNEIINLHMHSGVREWDNGVGVGSITEMLRNLGADSYCGCPGLNTSD